MDDDASTKIRLRSKNKDDSSATLKKVLFIGIGTALVAVLAIEMFSPIARQTNEKMAQKQQSEQEQASAEKQEQPDDPVGPQSGSIPSSASGARDGEIKPADTEHP